MNHIYPRTNPDHALCGRVDTTRKPADPAQPICPRCWAAHLLRDVDLKVRTYA